MGVGEVGIDHAAGIDLGLLAGFGYEVKYTAIVAVPYAAGFVAWKLWRQGKPVLRPVMVVSLIALRPKCILPGFAASGEGRDRTIGAVAMAALDDYISRL